MVLEVLESVKWVVGLEELKNKYPCQDRCETQYTTKTESFSSFDSGFEGKSTLCATMKDVTKFCFVHVTHLCDAVMTKNC